MHTPVLRLQAVGPTVSSFGEPIFLYDDGGVPWD